MIQCGMLYKDKLLLGVCAALILNFQTFMAHLLRSHNGLVLELWGGFLAFKSCSWFGAINCRAEIYERISDNKFSTDLCGSSGLCDVHVLLIENIYDTSPARPFVISVDCFESLRICRWVASFPISGFIAHRNVISQIHSDIRDRTTFIVGSDSE